MTKYESKEKINCTVAVCEKLIRVSRFAAPWQRSDTRASPKRSADRSCLLVLRPPTHPQGDAARAHALHHLSHIQNFVVVSTCYAPKITRTDLLRALETNSAHIIDMAV